MCAFLHENDREKETMKKVIQKALCVYIHVTLTTLKTSNHLNLFSVTPSPSSVKTKARDDKNKKPLKISLQRSEMCMWMNTETEKHEIL